MSTTRQSIVDLIDTNFKTITVVNGFSSNLGNNVFQFRDPPLADEELPALSYGDVSDIIGEEDEGEHNLEISVEITASGTTSPSAMRDMIQDVLTAYKLCEESSLIAEINYFDSELFPEMAKKKYMKARIRFGIKYFTEIFEI